MRLVSLLHYTQIIVIYNYKPCKLIYIYSETVFMTVTVRLESVRIDFSIEQRL